MNDLDYMHVALAEARAAAERGEVPVGCVIVLGDRLLARAGNCTISDCDPSAHAEIVALRAAAKTLGNYRRAAGRREQKSPAVPVRGWGLFPRRGRRGWDLTSPPARSANKKVPGCPRARLVFCLKDGGEGGI